MEKLRIAYLVHRYPTEAHAFILREVCTLRNLNFDIKVASLELPDRRIAQLSGAEIKETKEAFYLKAIKFKAIVQLHSYILFKQPWRYLKGLFFALHLLSKTDLSKIGHSFFCFEKAVILGHWLQQQQITHLHIHFTNTVSTIGLIVKKIFPINFSLTVYGPDEFYNTSAHFLTEKVTEADFICCISYFVRSQLMTLSPPIYWPKFEVCHIGMDMTLFKTRPFREKADPLEVLCIGELLPVHGQIVLLEAMTMLIAQGRHIRLRLVGEGPDRARLEAEALRRKLINHIVFEGAVTRKYILELYEKTDIFVLASLAEGFPAMLMEAMAMEIPCISTHIAGIPELISNGEEGMLVAPANAEMITRSVALLMDMPDLRRRLGQAGRKRILREYELQHNIERLATIFQQRLSEVQ